jgi:uncharacterized protein (DUF697 family)
MSQSSNDAFQQAIAHAAEAINTATRTAQQTAIGLETVILAPLQRLVAQGTETVGQIATPIAENPVVKFTTKVPGLKWIMAALGQVDVASVEEQVDALRRKYPMDTAEQLSLRVIQETAIAGGGVGLITNFVPPLALALFAVDLAALSALQAEMMYKIAAIYGFSLTEPTRRGELLALYGISLGSAGMIKTGLSVVEVLPGIGIVTGAASNATLLFGLGHIASRFYALKVRNQVGLQVSPSPISTAGEEVDSIS